jgi:predicted extracellular nuclease
MKKFLLSLGFLGFLVSAKAQSTSCSDLIISQYVEGSGNNKAIELYNTSPNPISLANYRLIHFNNGSDSATTLSNVTGDYILNLPTNITLASGESYVIVVDLRNPAGTGSNAPVAAALQALADTFLCNNCAPGNVRVMCYNGNDALSLQKNNGSTFVNVDVFGIMGDPAMSTASFWTDGNGANWTQNKTLTRKTTVLDGVKANPSSFDPSIQWDSLPQNTYTGLGSHVCNCPVVSNINKVNIAKTAKIINPVQNKTLELINTNELYTIEIYNATGALVKSINKISATKLDLNLNSGIYYARLKNKNGTASTQKIIIE